jgi:hypothetical protein
MRVGNVSARSLVAVAAMAFTLTAHPAHAAQVGDSSAARSLGPHPVTYTAAEIRNTGRFVVKGTATTYQGGRVKLQRKLRGGDWHRFDADTARVGDGYFKMRFDGPCGSSWRLALKAANGYDATKIKIGRITCY